MEATVAQAYRDFFRTHSGQVVLADLSARFTPTFPSYETSGSMDGITRISNAIHADGNKEVLLHIQGMIAEAESNTNGGEGANG